MTLTVSLPWYFSWTEQGQTGPGCRQNDQAIIVELENNPVMIDYLLIGWDWLLTGTEPFLHNKTVFYLDTPSFLPPFLSPQPDKTFLPSHDFRSPGRDWPGCPSGPPGPNCLFILHLSILSSPSQVRSWIGKTRNLSCFITLKTAIDLIWLILPPWAWPGLATPG